MTTQRIVLYTSSERGDDHAALALLLSDDRPLWYVTAPTPELARSRLEVWRDGAMRRKPVVRAATPPVDDLV